MAGQLVHNHQHAFAQALDDVLFRAREDDFDILPGLPLIRCFVVELSVEHVGADHWILNGGHHRSG